MESLLPTVTSILNYAATNGLNMGRYLLLGLVLTAALQSLVPSHKLHQMMTRSGAWPIVIASVAAVTTPLCSCGTISLMIPLLAAGVPWGPIFAWLIASPIISPTGFILVGGTLGWDLAIAKILVGLTLGIGGGILANKLQVSGFLANQSRVPSTRPTEDSMECCSQDTASDFSSTPQDPTTSGHSETTAASENRLSTFIRILWESGRSLIPIFILFVLVAGVIETLMPTEWITGLFGPGRAWGVPVAAILGVPLYTGTASAVPLTASFMGLGMSRAAALAFILTGPGTSLPALGAVLVIARNRMVAAYLGILFGGSILSAYLFGLWF